MDPITFARASFDLAQLVKRLSKTYDELDSRIDLMYAVSKQALIMCRISKSRVPDEMQDLCAIIEKKCITILNELWEWKGRFKEEGKNKRPSSFKGSCAKVKAQTRLPELTEDVNDIALHTNNLLLAVNIEAMASLAASKEAVNKKVDNIFAIVSRPPMDPGPLREPGKYVTIDDGLNPIFELPPSLCETPQRLQRTLAIAFESMPGLAQIKRGHFVAYHWNINRLICANEWPVVIEKGYGIRIAFVMGTWLPSKPNKCIRCLKPMEMSPRIIKGELISCKSCDLQFSKFGPLDFDYEPQDVSFHFGGYHDYKKKSHRKSSPPPSPALATSDASAKPRPVNGSTTSTDSGHLFCLYLAWASTPSHLVPEMTLHLVVSHTRHNDEGISFLDYRSLNYSNDT
ncbi:unnamed protein product [Clonostachys byssicola]|uniref:Ubiquitin-like domain-containing protein n=1 Tax=Clonostachys byssicola TaxID=160290 RepID=A0A9N9UY83_9HYPO|nr:unnamed protein product [Clonostachys byssicola]